MGLDKAMPYIYRRRILFGETDAARIVYTPRFTDYCMEAAEVWFRDYLLSDWYQMNAYEELGTPVVHMELDFFAPLIGNDIVEIEIKLSKVGNSTVSLAFEGLRLREGDNQRVKSFTALIIFCYFSNQTEKAMSIPAKQRQLLADYQAGCGLTNNYFFNSYLFNNLD